MNTEKHAADVLLDRGVSWPIRAPWFMRLIGIRKTRITVKALKLGTLLEGSRVFTGMNLDENSTKDPQKLILDHLDDVCLITAIYLLNSKYGIKLLSKSLSNHVKWQFTANMLLEVTVFAANFSSYTSFCNTIGLIRNLNVMTPKATNPSPEEQGSQQSQD